jgi:hypothetical protein
MDLQLSSPDHEVRDVALALAFGCGGGGGGGGCDPGDGLMLVGHAQQAEDIPKGFVMRVSAGSAVSVLVVAAPDANSQVLTP